MNVANQLLHVLTKLERWTATIAYVMVAGLLIGDILSREIFATSLMGAQKVAVLCAVTAAFSGFAMVTHEGGHLRIGGLDELIPKRFKALHQRAGDAVSAVLFMALAVGAFHFVQQSFSYGDNVPVLFIPVWPFQVILVYSMGVSALRHLIFLLWPDIKPTPADSGH